MNKRSVIVFFVEGLASLCVSTAISRLLNDAVSSAPSAALPALLFFSSQLIFLRFALLHFFPHPS